MRLTKHKWLFLVICCMVSYLYSQGVFSQTKVIDGTDVDGHKYVQKLMGEIHPADKAEMDTLYETITKYSYLVNARKGDIKKETLPDTAQEIIRIEVACKDETETQKFIDALKLLNPKKMVLKWHRCKHSDLTGEENVSCVEKPIDSYVKEKP